MTRLQRQRRKIAAANRAKLAAARQAAQRAMEQQARRLILYGLEEKAPAPTKMRRMAPIRG